MGDISAFVTKLLNLLRQEVGDDTYANAIHVARAHAGGVAKAENAKNEQASVGEQGPELAPVPAGSQVYSNTETSSRFLAVLSEPVELSDASRTISVQIFPKAGTYKHPSYGNLVVSPEFLSQIKTNFDQKIYQQELPLTIDLEHKAKQSGAAGWIRDVDQRGEDGLWATIEVNDRGAQLIQEDAFRYFSPEYYDSWQDPATQAEYANVLVGGALTNRPFFKGMQPIYVANERVYAFSEIAPTTPESEDTTEGKEEQSASAHNDNEAPNNPGETPEEMAMSIDPKEFTELQEKYTRLASALAEEKQSREAAEQSAKTATERVAAIERANLRRELSEMVRENRFAFKGETDEIVDRLEKRRAKLSEDEWAEDVAQWKAIHVQLRDSDILKQKSVEGDSHVADSEVDTLIAAEVSKGLDKPAALAKVLAENPNLYQEHVRKLNRRASKPE